MKNVLTCIALVAGLVSAAATAAGDGECPVHNSPLREVEVPIVYGLMPSHMAALKEQPSLFPHGDYRVEGGCLVGKARFATVIQCATCAVAKHAYVLGFTTGWEELQRIQSAAPKFPTSVK